MDCWLNHKTYPETVVFF